MIQLNAKGYSACLLNEALCVTMKGKRADNRGTICLLYACKVSDKKCYHRSNAR